MELIDGRALARKISTKLIPRITACRARGVVPCLEIILVGEDAASVQYVGIKEREAQRLGMECRVWRIAADADVSVALQLIESANSNDAVHGLIVQLPLPVTWSTEEVLRAIAPEKDIDCLSPHALGLLIQKQVRFVPPTAEAVVRCIRVARKTLKGASVVVFGSGMFGRQIALHLSNAGATVTTVNSSTVNTTSLLKGAEIVVSAVGRYGVVSGDQLRSGVIVVDVGVSQYRGKMVGDVAIETSSRKTGWLTPVPGGVGPVTVAVLLENTVIAAERVSGLID